MPSLNQWNIESGITASLHTIKKHSGNSCFEVRSNVGIYEKGITRGNSQQATILVWVYEPRTTEQRIGHLSYGNLNALENLSAVWWRLRISFWYDSANNTRWGKIEKWVIDHWVQWGTDTNFGIGVPALNPIRLGNKGSSSIYEYAYYDDIEVYKKAI